MTRRSTGLRYLATLVAVLGLALVDVGRARAQDEIPASPPAEAPVTDWVDVSCVADASGTTSCVFTATTAGGLAAEALTVTYDQLCGAGVLDAGGTENTGSGYRAVVAGGAATLWVLLAGSFAVSTDVAAYVVEAGGAAVAVNGYALACAPVEPEPPVADPPPTEPTATEPTTVGVPVYAANCPAAPSGYPDVPDAGVPSSCAPAVGLAFSASVDGVDLGTFSTDDAGAAVVVAPVGASLLLAEDLGTVAAGYVSLGDGTAAVDPVAEGAVAHFLHVPAAEPAGPDVPEAEEPDALEQPALGPSGIDEEALGRVQLIKVTCPTSEEPRTVVTVLGPHVLAAQGEAVSGCQTTGGAEFLVTGGSLPAAGETFVTEDDSSWRGELPAGLYEVTEVESDKVVEIEVVADGIVLVVAIEYVGAEQVGTVAVRRYACVDTSLAAEETEIETVFNPPDEPAAGETCAAEDGDFRFNAEEFDGNGDGAINVHLPIGNYQFTDLDSATSLAVDVAAEATTYVVVRRMLPAGELSVAYAFCTDEEAYQGNPSDAGFWAATCDEVLAGIELRLIDAAGNVVGTAVTDDDGIARFGGLMSGTYKIRGSGERSTCAVFVGGAASLGGFAVSANLIYQGFVYGCIKPPPDDGSGGGNNGGNNGGGNNGGGNNGGNNGGNPGGSNGGDGTGGTGGAGAPGGATSGSGDGTFVTTLPQTGSGSGAASLPAGLWFAGVIGLVALVGVRLRMRVVGGAARG